MKVISIIIPMYNSENFIKKCLDSLIISKNYLNKLDIVVVNDGSTDHSKLIVEDIAKKYDDLIQLVNKENGGHGSAINVGITYCKGKYVKVLDADDWVDTEMFEQVVLKLAKFEEDSIVTNYQTRHIVTGESRIYSNGQLNESILNMGQVLEQWEALKSTMCIHGLIFRLDYYKSLHRELPEHVFYDDAYYYTVMACFATKVRFMSEVVTVYRIGDCSQSVSNESRIKRIAQHEKVINSILSEKTAVDNYSKEAREYWLRKLETTICDYYVTALLRFRERKEGRNLAKNMKHTIMMQDSNLARRLSKRYCILYIMHVFHITSYSFEKFVASSIYKRLHKA